MKLNYNRKGKKREQNIWDDEKKGCETKGKRRKGGEARYEEKKLKRKENKEKEKEETRWKRQLHLHLVIQKIDEKTEG